MQLDDTWAAVLTLTQAHALPVPFVPDVVVGDTVTMLEPDGRFGHVWTRDLDQTGEDDVDGALASLGDAAPESLFRFAVNPPTSPRAPIEVEYVLSGPSLHLEVELDLDEGSAGAVRETIRETALFAKRAWAAGGDRIAVVVWPDVAALGPLPDGTPDQRWIRRHTTRDDLAQALASGAS